MQTDVADPEACTALVEAAMEEFGRVDVLVNNAGIGTAVPATRETPEQFRQVIDVNLNGCYWMAQACGRVMQPGQQHRQHLLASSASPPAASPRRRTPPPRPALIGLTRDLAQQWTGRKGIRVNALAPGFFASEMTDTYPEGYLDQAMARIPAGRKGDGAELAAAAGVPGQRRRRLRHRPDPRRRRRDDDHLTGPCDRSRPARAAWELVGECPHEQPAEPPHPQVRVSPCSSRSPWGSTTSYEQAQRAVDFLSDHEFPVENCMIVGTELKQIERVTGRLTTGRVALGGLLSGIWMGLFIGLIFSLFGTGSGSPSSCPRWRSARCSA